jgi:hypothetical protein
LAARSLADSFGGDVTEEDGCGASVVVVDSDEDSGAILRLRRLFFSAFRGDAWLLGEDARGDLCRWNEGAWNADAAVSARRNAIGGDLIIVCFILLMISFVRLICNEGACRRRLCCEPLIVLKFHVSNLPDEIFKSCMVAVALSIYLHCVISFDFAGGAAFTGIKKH